MGKAQKNDCKSTPVSTPAPNISSADKPGHWDRIVPDFIILRWRTVVAGLIIFATASIFLLFTGFEIGLTNDAPGWVIYPSQKEGTWISDLIAGRIGRILDMRYTEERWTLPIQDDSTKALAPVPRTWFWACWKLFGDKLGIIDGYRLGAVTLYALMLAFLLPWLARRYSLITGCIAGAFLLFSPHLFAYSQFIATDMPVTVFIILGTLAFYRAVRTNRWILFFVLFALAFLSKQQGLIFIIPLFAWGLWYYRRNPAARPWNPFRFFFTWGLISGGLILLLWPWLWHNPLQKLSQYFYYSAVPHTGGYYFGQMYAILDAADPAKIVKHGTPWHYPFVMILITTPPLVLLGLAAGIARTAIKRFNDDFSVLILLCGLFTVALIALQGGAHGIRYFVAGCVYFAILSGIGAGWLVELLVARWTARPALAAAIPVRAMRIILTATCVVGPLFGLLTVIPHGTAYYNAVIGGATGAQRAGFASGFWTTGMNRSFCNYLNRNAPNPARLFMFDVTGALSVYQADGKLRRDIGLVGMQPMPEIVNPDAFTAADYYISLYAERMRSFNHHQPVLAELLDANVKPVFAVEPDGQPILRLYARNKLLDTLNDTGSGWTQLDIDLGKVRLKGCRNVPADSPPKAGTTCFKDFLFQVQSPATNPTAFSIELLTQAGQPAMFFDTEYTPRLRQVRADIVRNPFYGQNPVHEFKVMASADFGQALRTELLGIGRQYKIRFPVKIPSTFPEGRFQMRIVDAAGSSTLVPDPAGTIEVRGRTESHAGARVIAAALLLAVLAAAIWWLGKNEPAGSESA